ncbi:GDSL esterase/lipase [Rhynchospora pubera]|uniref:GDSL esterase/lipase n=1 Tax=Rhynchospora pubera TaxID=906938 RepID=A0AAV8GB62_9POAL|nr:GDSL esterase/lipase [Rhynchospora pubera]
MAMFKPKFPSLFLVLLVLSIKVSPSKSYISFVFGDSLVDAGNNDYLFTISKANIPPYGIDFLPSGGKPTGRFTNGRTISDIIGQTLGQKAFPPPYLAPDSSRSMMQSGINFASGSSGILDDTGSIYIGRLPLRRQIDYFQETRNAMSSQTGENATSELLKKAIFFIVAGSNDILNYLQPSIPFFQGEKVVPSVLKESMLSNLTSHLKRLHELGARKFVVVDVGPLGCIPYVRALQIIPNGKCSSAANKLIRAYNEKLRQRIYQLNQEMGPASAFVYANSFDIVMQVLSNYSQYGFVNAENPCCGASFPPFLCFNSSSILCADRSKYVFWDAYHPTEAMNNIIASKFLDGDSWVVNPINVRKLYEYKLE